jgi:hypothetical protein
MTCTVLLYVFLVDPNPNASGVGHLTFSEPNALHRRQFFLLKLTEVNRLLRHGIINTLYYTIT